MSRVVDGRLVQFLCFCLLILIVAGDSPPVGRRIGGRRGQDGQGGRHGGRQHNLGGWRRISTNDTEVETLAGTGVTTLESTTNSPVKLKLMRIIHAQSQVVSGMKYRISLLIGHTTCDSGSNITDRCHVKKVQTCELEIWTQKWLNKVEMTNHTCSRVKFAKLHASHRSMPGGISAADVEETPVKDAAKFAAGELATKSNGLYRVNLFRTVEATKQVVSGMKYRLIIDVQFISAQDSQQTHALTCLVEVVDQAWLTPRYRLLKHECDTDLIPSLQ